MLFVNFDIAAAGHVSALCLRNYLIHCLNVKVTTQSVPLPDICGWQDHAGINEDALLRHGG